VWTALAPPRKSIPPKENAMNVRKLSSLAAALVMGMTLAACAGTATTKSTGDVVDDSWIATKVKAQLIDDPLTKARDIQVETFKGTVQLSGFADSQAEVDRAVQIAGSTQGVKSVRNNITLKASTPR
jgi:hyperosmotically inducible periplasmic protein